MLLTAGMRLGPYEILSATRRRGHGRGLSRPRSAARSRRRHQGPAGGRLRPIPTPSARFEREAKALAALSHPNLLAIHDFGVQDRTVYAVMELLEGETLRETARATGRRCRCAKRVDYARRRSPGDWRPRTESGIVHRDLKPENVFVTATGASRSSTSAWRSSRTPGVGRCDDGAQPTRSRHGHGHGRLHGAGTGARRDRSIIAPTSSRSAACSTRWLPAGARSSARQPAETMTAILHEDPPRCLRSGGTAGAARKHHQPVSRETAAKSGFNPRAISPSIWSTRTKRRARRGHCQQPRRGGAA